MIAVILDGGHGFNTPGKRSPDQSFRENEFNDSIVNKLSYVLYSEGIPCEIISSEWSDVPLKERMRREHKAHDKFRSKGYFPIFISIHANAAESTKANGYETFTVPSPSQPTEKLAEFIHNDVYEVYSKYRKNSIDRGIKEANFYVLKNSKSSAVLIECGFMTNKEDLEVLKNENFRNDLTKNLMKTILRYDIHN